jgi:hypothetical protein
MVAEKCEEKKSSTSLPDDVDQTGREKDGR